MNTENENIRNTDEVLENTETVQNENMDSPSEENTTENEAVEENEVETIHEEKPSENTVEASAEEKIGDDGVTENASVNEAVSDLETPSEIMDRQKDSVSAEQENIEEAPVDEVQPQAPSEEPAPEAPVEKDFIDEFTPATINIPNYNKEKEMLKREKASLKAKKKNTKKSKKRRRLIRKIVNVTRAVVLFILLLAVSVVVLSSVIVRVNTSEFAVESAINDYGPERITVGKIKEPEKLAMNESSDSASMADVLRDNATIPVTYAQIEQAVNKSTYPEFVSGIATDVLGYYVYGDSYSQVNEEEIADVMYKNASKIKIVTGQELNESSCKNFAKYIVKSPVYKEISESELKKQEAAEHTHVTSVIFSFPVLIGMVIALMLLLVLVIVACRGYVHKIIGWALMLAGLVSGVAGFLIKPAYVASTEFVKCVVDAITAAFNRNSLIYGAVVFAMGLLVLLVGSAMKESASDDDDEDEDEYIEEIEQVSTAL